MVMNKQIDMRLKYNSYIQIYGTSYSDVLFQVILNHFHIHQQKVLFVGSYIDCEKFLENYIKVNHDELLSHKHDNLYR